MSSKNQEPHKFVTKDNLIYYMKALAKEFRKLNGTVMSAEIILIGGAAILAFYSFREMTTDIDAIIISSSAMKQAINLVGDKHGLANGWLNSDFQNTSSYSNKLPEVSRYYKTFSNIVTVRIVVAEYLIAMKMMSGRQYKNDLSDIIGIVWEHYKIGNIITREMIDNAVKTLYGNDAVIPAISINLIDTVMQTTDYEPLYNRVKADETVTRLELLEFNKKHPNTLKAENIDQVIARIMKTSDRGGIYAD